MAGDIHALEIEFAKNPNLETCIPLCEAYLGHKRFMEAMVVCKKGIKSSPKDPRGRVMLSRVYLDQGKLPKAEAELNTALQASPGNPSASEVMGQILIKQGRNQEAVPFLQQAAAGDPNLATARALLQQLGEAVPTPQAAPAQQPAPQAAQQPAPQAAQQPAPQAAQQAMPQAAQPQMPQAAQPQMPQAAQPPMPQAGQPGQNPWAVGTGPALGPSTKPAPNQVPAGLPHPAQVGVQPQATAPKLEHVSDFFAEETLGFEDDASNIETAGPGRLTILGFVPKSTGSIKTTIGVALAVFAIAGLIILWQVYSAKNTRRINKLFGEVRVAMGDDLYPRYQDALRTGQEILKVDDDHNLTLSAMAYAEAILGTDHAVAGAAAKSRKYLAAAMKADDKENEFRVSARAVLAYEAKKYEEGIADVKKILDKGGSSPLIELEALRLMDAANPDSKETNLQLRRTIQSVVSQARIYNFLGWYYYEQENWSTADQYFDQALQNSRGHPVAMLGQALTDLGRGIGLKERQKEIAKNIKKVFSLPKEELSLPVTALAHFARGMLLLWQLGNPIAIKKVTRSEVEADFAKALKIDPQNAMFHYRRGVQQLVLRDFIGAIKSLKKAAALNPNSGRYYKRLCEAQTGAGLLADAKASCRRALQLTPGDSEIKLREGLRLLREKNYDRAIAQFGLIAKQDSAVIYCRANIGKSTALRESGQAARAVKHMEAFFEQVPGGCQADIQAELWCELGQNYMAVRNKEQAIQAFTVGIEQYPYYPDCYYHLAKAFGRGPEVKDACKRYLAVAPRGIHAKECDKKVNR